MESVMTLKHLSWELLEEIQKNIESKGYLWENIFGNCSKEKRPRLACMYYDRYVRNRQKHLTEMSLWHSLHINLNWMHE